jgi:hypothetical protein
MVPAGSVLSFEVRGVAGGWTPTTLDSLRSDLVSYLSSYVGVQALNVRNAGAFYEQLEWPFVATMTVQTYEAHAAASDVGSLISHAIYEATGNMPTVGGIGSQGGMPTETGGGGLFGSIGDAVGDLIGGATAPITSEFNFILLAVGAVAVVLLVSLGGKSTRIGVGL